MHNVSLPLVPSTPLGLENQILSDNYLSDPSQLNSSTGPYLVRLNEQQTPRRGVQPALVNGWTYS